jgi:hypothetical protein
MEKSLQDYLAVPPRAGKPGRGSAGLFAFTKKMGVALIVFMLFLSTAAMASHFKGGQITYRYMGGGQYDIYIKSYWDKTAVGNINPSYEGAPKINTISATLSKTLLPDGQTIEHYQKQTVTWSQPGFYNISWRSCCRSVGTNFGNNDNGLFAAVNYNPNVPSSSPQFYDLPIFNFTAEEAIRYNLNMEDPDGHEQEYSLEIPYGVPGDPYKLMRESGFSITNDGTVNWTNPLKGLWLVNVKLIEKVNGVPTGAFILRDFILNISSSSNTAPAFEPVAPVLVKEGQPVTLQVKAHDVDGEAVYLLASGSAFESGASFTQQAEGSSAVGTFTWTPAIGALGKYNIQFVATDNNPIPLSSQITVTVTVVADVCELEAAYTITAKPCLGTANGKISLSGSNGTAPYAYSLDGGKTYQSEALFTNLAGGEYVGLVKDAANCVSAPLEISLQEEVVPLVSFTPPASVVCTNAGAITLSGGYPDGGVYTGTGVLNGVFSPAVAGAGTHSITYTYTNNNGCNSTASATITVTDAPVASAGEDKVVYYGYQTTRCTTLAATATSGSGSYTYRWNTGATSQKIEVCPTTTTTYTVTVTDASGCSSTDEVTVKVYDVRCGNKNDKVIVCHKGKPICIAPQAVQAHLDHGDVLGDCSEGTAGSTADAAEEENIVTVYPNPMKDRAIVKLQLQEKDNVKVDVVDMKGKVVKKLFEGATVANEELEFEVSSNIGKEKVYIVRLTTKRGVQHFKLMLD